MVELQWTVSIIPKGYFVNQNIKKVNQFCLGLAYTMAQTGRNSKIK